MTPEQFSEYLKAEQEREARQVTIRAITEALMTLFHIHRQGRELVYLLADGRGRNNVEAVRAWVSDALPKCSRGEREDVENLRRRMGSMLSSIGEGS